MQSRFLPRYDVVCQSDGLADATLYYHRENIFRHVLEREFCEYINLMNQLN